MMGLEIEITAPNVQDAARMAVIDEIAYVANPMRSSLSTFSIATSQDQARHLEWSTEILKQRMEQDQSSLFFKAVEKGTGTLVGWSEWKKPDFEGPKAIGRDEPRGKHEADQPKRMTPCLRMDRIERFVSMWEAARIRAMKDRKDYWCLAKLAVDPCYQRHGVGTAMLDQGLALVDETGMEVYTAATPAGLKLVENKHFKQVEQIECEGVEEYLVTVVRGVNIAGLST